MMKKIAFILLFLVFTLSSHAQHVTKFEELQLKMIAEPRPVVVKIYTQWCSVCKLQDKKIQKDERLKNIFNGSVYYLELDAESRKTITFGNKVYQFIPNGTGGVNKLAAELCLSQSYPCWVFLAPDYSVIQTYSGLLKPEQLAHIISKL
ncbi:hypothetical protein LRS05_05040 [Flavobacterium sp. J372]|uniref:thioredoxin family protein n=1 Tax=Flavobacterium sp. J372 TaxID=2898436 RepID=UPI0021513402|nr:hypothetical protein [Flavobacterium sp. J372]MCR5861544.1 hypothetical protein [Flavobacterium sp. J372]